jgi:uronate dehydrogenase
MVPNKPRVLLTGAAGNVGSALRSSWEAADRFELTLTDVRPFEDAKARVEIGDIRDAELTRRLCANQDALVHLSYLGASNAGADTTDELTDIGLSMRLFRQAGEAGVSKIVYASTNHVSGMNETLYSPPRFCTADMQRPDGWYGAMKGMSEIAGRYLSDAFDLRFISIRIGTFTGNDEPEILRLCSTLLTPRDGAQLFGLAVDYKGPEKFLVTYGTSGNSEGEHRSFLDISPAVEILGYRPQDNCMKHRHRFVS